MTKQEKRRCTICKEIRRTTNKESNPYVCEACLKRMGREFMKPKEDVVIPSEKVLNKGLALILFLVGFFVGLVIRGLFK